MLYFNSIDDPLVVKNNIYDILKIKNSDSDYYSKIDYKENLSKIIECNVNKNKNKKKKIKKIKKFNYNN